MSMPAVCPRSGSFWAAPDLGTAGPLYGYVGRDETPHLRRAAAGRHIRPARVARIAESCGFDALFRSDHYLTMGGEACPGRRMPGSPWPAWPAKPTRIRLGTLLTSATFRLPGVLAVSVAQVDAMSGGRVELGLGTGWYEDEHRAYGIPFPPLGERFERLEEQFAILTGLWATPVGEKFSFAGSTTSSQTARRCPSRRNGPTRRSSSAAAGQRTPPPGRHVCGRVQSAVPQLADTEAQFSRVRAACESTGRDPGRLGLSVAQVVCCGADEADFNRRAKAIGRDLPICGRTAWRGRRTRWSRGCVAFGLPERAPSTSRCSTSTTSTTSSCSARRAAARLLNRGGRATG